jgi:hypothetical protein
MRNKDKAESSGQEFKGEKPRYAIKADAKAKYIYVKDVFKTFTDMKNLHFQFDYINGRWVISSSS